jgi:hypothetical protein
MAAGSSKDHAPACAGQNQGSVPHLERRIEEFTTGLTKQGLRGMKDLLKGKAKPKWKTVVKYGSPSLEILRIAEDLDVSLL